MLLMTGIVHAEGPQPRPGSDGLGDPLYPLLGNGGYDALHYILELTVDVDKNVISGTVEIDAQATQDLSAFNLDFVGFEISALTVDNIPAKYSRTEHELTIMPAKPLLNGKTFTTSITYSGTPNTAQDIAPGCARY